VGITGAVAGGIERVQEEAHGAVEMGGGIERVQGICAGGTIGGIDSGQNGRRRIKQASATEGGIEQVGRGARNGGMCAE